MTGGSDEGARKPSWIKWALIASLAANLLIVGSVMGAFWSHRHGGRHFGPGQDRELGLMGFVRELAPDRQGEMRTTLEAEREKLKPLRDGLRDGWKETNGLLVAEPFDKDKLKAAMVRMIESETRLRTAVSDVLVETSAKLSAEERQKLKAWRERRGFKSSWRHKWRERMGGDKDGGKDKD